jgi:peptidoglycan/LPS O-acetylase OafA/YrhL
MGYDDRGKAPRERFIAGDALRAIAALGVVLFHVVYPAAQANHPHGGGTMRGEFGSVFGPLFANLDTFLYLFFVLSGYLIAGPFVRALIEGDALPGVRRYARSRVLRIVPAFWVVAVLTFVTQGVDGSSVKQVGAVFGFAQIYVPSTAANLFGQAWTLNVEMGFYVLVPLVGALAALACRHLPLKRRGRALLLLGFTAFVAMFTLSLRASGPGSLDYQRMVPIALFFFCPGIALAAIEPFAKPWLRARPAFGRRLALVALAGGIGAFLVAASLTRPSLTIASKAALTAATATGLLVGAALIRHWADGGCWRVLTSRPLRWLGERSYGIYLVHFLVILEVSKLVDDPREPWEAVALRLPLVVAGTLVLATLSWRFVEQPARAWRRRPRKPVPLPEPALVLALPVVAAAEA